MDEREFGFLSIREKALTPADGSVIILSELGRGSTELPTPPPGTAAYAEDKILDKKSGFLQHRFLKDGIVCAVGVDQAFQVFYDRLCFIGVDQAFLPKSSLSPAHVEVDQINYTTLMCTEKMFRVHPPQTAKAKFVEVLKEADAALAPPKDGEEAQSGGASGGGASGEGSGASGGEPQPPTEFANAIAALSGSDDSSEPLEFGELRLCFNNDASRLRLSLECSSLPYLGRADAEALEVGLQEHRNGGPPPAEVGSQEGDDAPIPPHPLLDHPLLAELTVEELAKGLKTAPARISYVLEDGQTVEVGV